ncbi:hypothetical protein SAMN05660841_00287 [Sphingobacterium nematocida]|uniref:Lipoprotein n=1 Tax=Sphingobacterium nematocida TaxID=1513896 RepID=A0A1T5AXY9_9SPHI|nr:hypothetical protein [Sphingobacterium nematocida]SKB39921.1 hypothetical protein SAMN05660841_00287 [Sphingobacterium nematocida]
MRQYIYLIFFFLLITLGCREKHNIEQSEAFVHTDGRDSISVVLHLVGNTFQGTYTESRPGGFLITDELSGDVKKDTLLGSLYYTPYKGRNKKRKAFALLKQNDSYIIGKGASYIYMGVPYFERETLTFNGHILRKQ